MPSCTMDLLPDISSLAVSNNEYDLAVNCDHGLSELFHAKVKDCPKAVAIVDSEVNLTYAQLHVCASYLAEQLSQPGLKCEEPVGILVQHGFADVVAQMAVIYAGGTCVPIDPTLPDHQIQSRLARLNTQHLLVDQTNQGRELPFHIICLDRSLVAGSGNLYPTNTYSEANGLTQSSNVYPVITSLEHCTHLIHTSGTTDEPKAVRIAARSILHVVFHAPFQPLHATDVVAHANNSSFDVSLFDVWAPLLRGARIAVLSKAILLDPPLMAKEIDRLGITVMVRIDNATEF